MPHALPVGRERYVQYLRTDPAAPRREPARTHEVRGKKRHGEGTAFRLFAQHAVVLGRWTGRSMTATETEEFEYQSQNGERLEPWGRLIGPEEIDFVAKQVFQEKVETGWQPPRWHWRFYWDRLSGVLNNVGLMHVVAYNEARWTPRRFVQFLYDRLKMRMFPVHTDVPEQRGNDTEGLTL